MTRFITIVNVLNSIVHRVERSETLMRQFSDPPGPVGAVCNRLAPTR